MVHLGGLRWRIEWVKFFSSKCIDNASLQGGSRWKLCWALMEGTNDVAEDVPIAMIEDDTSLDKYLIWTDAEELDQTFFSFAGCYYQLAIQRVVYESLSDRLLNWRESSDSNSSMRL
jgi:hypothetical protein